MVIVKKEFEELLRKQSKEEERELEKSIVEDGCRDPLILWGDILVDGHHRFKICKKHDLPFATMQKHFIDDLEAKLWIIRNQRSRRNLSILDFAELALLEKDLLTEEAKKRSLMNLRNVAVDEGFIDRVPVPNRPDEPGRISEKLSELYGVGEKTIRQVDKIKQVAPERLEEIRSGDKSIKAVYSELMRQQNRELREKEYKDNPLPEGEFDVVYADPPWRYDFCVSENRRIENHYDTMSLEAIKNIEIPAANDSVLFLWATQPLLLDAVEVIKAWKFDYKGLCIWNKQTFGMGYWFRIQHEFLLLGVKGNIGTPEPANRISSIISIKAAEHSKKPDEFYDIIEKMYPGRKYLELFARQKHSDKWSVWGNEI